MSVEIEKKTRKTTSQTTTNDSMTVEIGKQVERQQSKTSETTTKFSNHKTTKVKLQIKPQPNQTHTIAARSHLFANLI
jgi:hypothetical protein